MTSQRITPAFPEDLAALNADEIAARVENILEAIHELLAARRGQAELNRLTALLHDADEAFQVAAYGTP